MKIVVIAEKGQDRDEVVEKLCSVFGLKPVEEGVAESQGASNIEPGVYVSSDMAVSLAKALYFDMIVVMPCRPKDNRVTRYKLSNERIWALYEVDEDGNVTDKVVKSRKGFPYDYIKKGYAMTLQRRMNDTAGRITVAAKIMPEFVDRV